MLPKINGKSLLDCLEDDLELLIDNSDYRENECLDFKEQFSIQIVSKDIKAKEINKFRSDVCAFANANGGYILYGIKEDGNAIATELVGIDIINKDKFELELKTYLGRVEPKIPNYKVSFVDLKNGKTIFVLKIEHDYFAPYFHLVDEKYYAIHKRVGNSNVVIPYAELRNMFTQSISLEKEIGEFRKERIDYYKSIESTENIDCSKFVLFHIIPDSFLDRNYNKNIYASYRNGEPIGTLFSVLHVHSVGIPMVEGMRLRNSEGEEVRLFNNLIAEYYSPIQQFISGSKDEPFLAWELLWQSLVEFYGKYLDVIRKLLDEQRVFLAISIIGCKGFLTDNGLAFEEKSRIDRNLCIMEPIALTNLCDIEEINKGLKKFRLEYLFSIGVRNADGMNALIKEVYG